MRYGLERIGENRYKCFKYTLLGWGVKKEDKTQYVLIDKKEARKIKYFIRSFYIIVPFFTFAMGRGSGSFLDSIFHNIVFFWMFLCVFSLLLVPYFLNQFYKKLYTKHKIIKQ